MESFKTQIQLQAEQGCRCYEDIDAHWRPDLVCAHLAENRGDILTHLENAADKQEWVLSELFAHEIGTENHQRAWARLLHQIGKDLSAYITAELEQEADLQARREA